MSAVIYPMQLSMYLPAAPIPALDPDRLGILLIDSILDPDRWLAGLLACWLAGLLAGWLACWLAGLLAGWLACLLALLACLLAGWLACLLACLLCVLFLRAFLTLLVLICFACFVCFACFAESNWIGMDRTEPSTTQ